MTTYHNFADMLGELSAFASKAAGIEGADSVGAFIPIGKFGQSRGFGEFSSLSEWLDDIADTIDDFLASSEGDEVGSWEAA